MNANFRAAFPSLQREHNGQPLIYLDGPGGTQVPEAVIEACSSYYRRSNANTHGQFITAQETDSILDHTRLACAQFLGASGPRTISFGQNMTTLNFSLARAMARIWQPGDEVLITQLDHEANRGPWLALREHGIVVKEVKLLPEGRLDYLDLEAKLNDRTRLLAMGYSSNFMGTINDVALARQLTHQVGAWLLLDAVHYAPHFPMDVEAIDCDFLLCSAYKFYGPHIGILYARPGLLDALPVDRLRTADQEAPYSMETGTLNHSALAGVGAALTFLASFGKGEARRDQLVSAMRTIQAHEWTLFSRLFHGLADLPGVEIIGTGLDETQRAPTLAIRVHGHHPTRLCQQLAAENIMAWDGHFYAIRATEVLGLRAEGGVTRMGVSAYTSAEEIERVLSVMERIVA
ncbi:MAG: cysteine desulfurase-like protein [Saprospiraceae bacterium]|nr:cysteine desulfurase-like protein [Saprospiraceae bacterium]